MDYILRVIYVYTKTRVSRVKVVYESGKMRGGTILNLMTSVMWAEYMMMLEVLPKESWHDQRSMDQAKSGAPGLGAVIKC